MRKRIVALALTAALLFGTRPLAQEERWEPTNGPMQAAGQLADTAGYSTKAKGAVLMDAGTGRVLFAQNAKARLPMASTTKIMSAMLTLEEEDLDTEFQVDSAAIMVEGSSMGLRKGDTVTLRALAYGMLLPSGNDAANAAAVRVAGSKDAFAGLMNRRARELNMRDTHFVTPSGLDDPKHYSSAYDMALLAREALQNPEFIDICSRAKAVVHFGNPPYDRWLQNHNRLLQSYPGTIGVKTGFTDSAGRCLVSCVERDGVRLIAVTLGCPDDWNEHKKLYDRYFGQLTQADPGELIPRLTAPVAGAGSGGLPVGWEPSRPVALLPGETLKARVVWTQPFFYAPVARGQLLGRVEFSCGGVPVGETALVAQEAAPSVTKEQKSPFAWLENLFL